MTNYQNSLASFTMKNQFQIDWYFNAHVLPLVNGFLICLYIQTVQQQLLWIKVNNLLLWLNIQYDVQTEIKNLGTLYAMFTELSDAQLTGYSNGDE